MQAGELLPIEPPRLRWSAHGESDEVRFRWYAAGEASMPCAALVANRSRRDIHDVWREVGVHPGRTNGGSSGTGNHVAVEEASAGACALQVGAAAEGNALRWGAGRMNFTGKK